MIGALFLYVALLGWPAAADYAADTSTAPAFPSAGRGVIFGGKLEHLSIEQGLSQTTVNAITRDKQGFMWFGTQDGLNKYDGYNFTVYKHHPGDSTSISDNWIYHLFQDSQGYLWVCTHDGGLSRFDPSEELFTSFRQSPADSNSVSRNNVTSVVEDASGGLWVTTWGGGIDRFDRKTGKWTHYRHNPLDSSSLSGNNVWCSYVDSKAALWVGTWSGLNKFDPAINGFVHYEHDPSDARSLCGDKVTTIVEDHQGNLWIGDYENGISRYEPATGTFVRYKSSPGKPAGLSSNRVTTLHVGPSGNVWVGTIDAGLSYYDAERDEFFNLRFQSGGLSALSDNGIISMYEDSTGMLWIGTYGNGLNMYGMRHSQFALYTSDDGTSKSPAKNNIRALCRRRNGEIWVGTRIGVSTLDRERRKLVPCFNDPRTPERLIVAMVAAICEDKYGALWFGTDGAGVYRFDARSNTLVNYRHNPGDQHSLSENTVMAVYEDRRGDLWFGTFSSGLDRFDRTLNSFTNYRRDDTDPKSLSGNNVWSLYEDSHGDFWVGTWGTGLNRFDRTTHTATRYVHDPGNSSSLSNNTVWSMEEDSTGNLWLGTWGGGLNRFDRAKNSFTAYTERDGLPNNVVYGILPDGGGNLWLSTNKGLSRFTAAARTFKNYDVADGLQGNEFNQGAYCRDASGELFFGGINGLTSFFPHAVRDNPHIPPVVITSFRVFDRPLKIGRTISAGQPIELAHSQNYFSVEFVALDYTVPAKNRYAYKLEGFDESWIQSGTRRYAAYTNLEPGTYVLRVRGSNNDGVWNESGASLHLSILPPFWKRWWFRILVACGVLGVLFLLYRYRVSKLLEIERMRVRIASDLHDDIGATLTKISLYSDLLKDHPAAERAVELIQRIGSMSRDVVTTMSDVVWSIDARNDSVGDLLDRMRDMVSSVLSPKQIDVSFDVEGLDIERRLPVDIRQNLYLIFKEAITNVAKHAGATEVRVRLAGDGRGISMTIQDNGKGMGGRKRLTGQGLRNMSLRAERIGARLDVSENNGVTIVVSAAGT